MSKACSCALNVSDLFSKFQNLLYVYEQHAKTGKLPVTAREVREQIETASAYLQKVAETCGIDISHAKTFLDDALKHYESGLMKGDIHSLSEAAELAAEAELPLLRELWSCQEKEAKEKLR